MDYLRTISLSSVITLTTVLRYLELVLQIHSSVVAIVFIIVFSKIRSIHIDLIVVLESFMMSCLFASLVRIYPAIQVLLPPNAYWRPVVLKILRFITVYAVSGNLYPNQTDDLYIYMKRLRSAVAILNYSTHGIFDSGSG
ncbi:hypothetical protein KIN20_033926 [Parelaphostrongylus tenuis]|uniref:Uncharacterized protein n=1 Tax=Parelaphostrongylus tenuis TaxID=148309 RepID=A0AAD5R9H8_PARTN|nr:hypothetical protein KIN20_033926 [Parelaphostrongylus tenuis]